MTHAKAELDRLEALEKEATEGPWVEGIEDGREAYVFSITADDAHWVTPRPEPGADGEGVLDADACFIAALRNAAPALIAVARAAEAYVSYLPPIGAEAKLSAALARLDAEATKAEPPKPDPNLVSWVTRDRGSHPEAPPQREKP